MNGAFGLPITSLYSRFSNTMSMVCGGWGLAGTAVYGTGAGARLARAGALVGPVAEEVGVVKASVGDTPVVLVGAAVVGAAVVSVGAATPCRDDPQAVTVRHAAATTA